MNRRDFYAMQKIWAKQEPAQGCARVALVLSVESVCDEGAVIHASVELDKATALWILRELQRTIT